MTHPWPLFDLCVRTPRLELRLPADDEIVELSERADEIGIHDPSFLPFLNPWTQEHGMAFVRNSLQHHWIARGRWTSDDWGYLAYVFIDGRAVGCQSLHGRHFGIKRSAGTGSWLLRSEQGRGIGTEMRRAVLALAFDGLGALTARSGYFPGNDASRRVSERLGYVPDGTEERAGTRERRVEQRMVITSERWFDTGHGRGVEIEGLDACLELFGATECHDRSRHHTEGASA